MPCHGPWQHLEKSVLNFQPAEFLELIGKAGLHLVSVRFMNFGIPPSGAPVPRVSSGAPRPIQLHHPTPAYRTHLERQLFHELRAGSCVGQLLHEPR